MSSLSNRRRALLLSSALIIGTAAAATTASAGSFGLREQSATGQGISFAGMAAGGGDSISGMFWNPAVMNQVAHFQGEQHVAVVLPSSKVDVIGGNNGPFGFGTRDGGNIGENAILTSGYSAYRLTDQVAVGLSINTPFGLKTKANRDFGGEIFGRSSEALSVNATPTIGYKFNDQFSVAAGVQIQYFDIKLRQALGLPGTPSERPLSTLKGDDIGVGYTLGATFSPSEWTSVGVGFRSKIKHKLEGDFYNGTGEVPGSPIPTDGKIRANVTLPETLSVGVRQKVTQDLTLLAGFEWTNWSRLNSIPISKRSAGGLPNLSFDYDDGYFVSGGVEYAYSPELTLRTGVGYEWSPVNNKNRGVRIPDDDRWWLSAGGSYNYSQKLSFDLGYSYVFVSGKSKIQVNPGDPDNTVPTLPVGGGLTVQDLFGSFNASAKSDVHIISAAVRYKFGEEAPAALVTKY